MPPSDPLYDFPPEPITVHGEPTATTTSGPARTPPDHATDSTSRVISFVLGFALASLIAWLGNIRADRPAPTPADAVATTGTPVVADTTEETSESKGPVPVTSAPVASAPAETVSVASAPVAPEPPPVRAVQVKAVAGRAVPDRTPAVRTVPTRVTPVEPAQPKSSSTTVGYRGVLVLNSTPEGAEVVVNGQVVGQTPVVLSNLPVGSRAILVRRDGYSPWSTSVRIVANQQTTVQARLTPVP